MSARSAVVAGRIVRSGMGRTSYPRRCQSEHARRAQEGSRRAGLVRYRQLVEELLLLDHAPGDPAAAVAGWIGFQIVFLGVDDDGVADDVILAAIADRDAHDRLVQVRLAVGAGLDVAEVAGVAGLAVRGAM